ncbi:MAG: zinc ribbon domain-containing protein [Ktedonobacteraceae bacterium]|nr:zinc ribbon domain-containing protein [Ktedonobacteraceae bacterium]
MGIIRQANLETQLLSALDSAAFQQGAQVHVTNESPFSPQTPPHQGPRSSYSHPYNAPPQSGPMPGSGQKQCPRCQAVNDVDDAFCSRCGSALNSPKKVCANCKAELKADAAFCTKCGTAAAR